MTTPVELIYDSDCPNIEAARQQLRLALEQSGQPARWTEWERNAPQSPAYVRQFGSPTILVGGVDVAGTAPSAQADCCRLYANESGDLQGVPSIEAICSALREQPGETQALAGGPRSWLPILPAVGVSLLPNLACPACWPAYAGLLSAMGLGFLAEATYLLPLTGLFLMVAVGALAWQSRNRRGPVLLGLLAAVTVLAGKFWFDSSPAMAAGIVLLAGATFWNVWPTNSPECPTCEPSGPLQQT
ncbi:hypothetical protein Mal4_31300 [Maioricimonas rarisocia]|uniref:MerC mercury resistance protein n=1 Tax=Maioricimonas rarisocia TaxID=2528026 RepID=A0A517Z8I1_9PLAN|nr:MerC family mercury resistance protein [Maioricimonas rarisocia]QDU38800.1 hypothetical protein Mal4_31300 [Maioricimonas rarisocia]